MQEYQHVQCNDKTSNTWYPDRDGPDLGDSAKKYFLLILDVFF